MYIKSAFHRRNITKVFGLHIKIELNCQTLHVSASTLGFSYISSTVTALTKIPLKIDGYGSALKNKDDWCKKQKHHRISNSNCTNGGRRRRRREAFPTIFFFISSSHLMKEGTKKRWAWLNWQIENTQYMKIKTSR